MKNSIFRYYINRIQQLQDFIDDPMIEDDIKEPFRARLMRLRKVFERDLNNDKRGVITRG